MKRPVPCRDCGKPSDIYADKTTRTPVCAKCYLKRKGK